MKFVTSTTVLGMPRDWFQHSTEWAERHLNYAWFGSENLRHPHVKDNWKVVDRYRRKMVLHAHTEETETPQ